MAEKTNHRTQEIPSGVTSQDTGADEATVANVSVQQSTSAFQQAAINALTIQQMQENQRQQTAEFEQRLRQQEEMHAAKMRKMEDESTIRHVLNGQTVRHGDLAIDSQWNVNEDDHAAANILREQSRREDAR